METECTFLGQKLEIVNEKVVFEKPIEMLAWNHNNYPTKRTIVAILPNGTAIDIDHNWIEHCAYIPDALKPRTIPTNKELAELPIEQQRENNFWHLSDYLIGELIHLDKSLEGQNVQDLIAKRKVDIFNSLEGLAKKILDNKTIYGVSIIDKNDVHNTYYIDVDSDLSGTSFITHVNHRVAKMLGSEDFAIISIFKIP